MWANSFAIAVAAGALAAFAAPASAQDGQATYNAHCLSCHQTDGRGVPNVFPDLTESAMLAGRAGPLLRYVMYQEKPADFEGSGGFAAMPAFTYLSDEELAAALTYIRSEFSAGAGSITPEQVAAERS